MNQWKPEDLSKSASVAADLTPSSLQPQSHLVTLPSNRLLNSHTDSRQRPEAEAQDPVAARKLQKADREKLRRDRLNEHFLELGNTLDPDRPKNDKATILTDTIQVLKDLTAEVNRLKAEHATLSEESHELMQEKNELREEKTSLKSDIENLNAQYQQRVRVTFPWTAIDHSVVMPPPYSYPLPIPIPPAPISIHPSLQPFPFFGNQNQGPIPNPCSTFVPFSAPVNPPLEQPTAQYASTSHISSKQDSRSKSPDHERPERCGESNDVATELELKMPGQKDVGSLTTWLRSLNLRCLDHRHDRNPALEEGRASIQRGRREMSQRGVLQAGSLHLKDFKIVPTVWVISLKRLTSEKHMGSSTLKQNGSCKSCFLAT